MLEQHRGVRIHVAGDLVTLDPYLILLYYAFLRSLPEKCIRGGAPVVVAFVMAYYCGLDFGTSNSVIAICSDDDLQPTTLREPSLIYFPDDPDTAARRHCGSEALIDTSPTGCPGDSSSP